MADKTIDVNVIGKADPSLTQAATQRGGLGGRTGALGGGGGIQGPPREPGGLGRAVPGGSSPIHHQETMAIQQKTAARKQHITVLQQEATAAQHNNRTSQQSVRQAGMLSATMVAVNMSMLGVMFGWQNLSKVMGQAASDELFQLQLQDKKSKQDKKRMKELRKEQREQQKLNEWVNAGISTLMITLSMGGMVLAMRRQLIAAKAQDSAATATNTSATLINAKAEGIGAVTTTAHQAAKSGWMAPAMVAIIVGAAITGAMILGSIVATRGAAQGAFVPAQAGGSPFIVGEGGQDEIITPIPKMKESFREVLTERGGNTVIINAIDVQSFRDAFTDSEEAMDLMGVQRDGR